MANDLVPGMSSTESYAAQTETLLAGVDGGVRNTLVQQIRKLVEKNPEGFVSSMRRWLHEGRGYDD